jgi:hypothetical protein
VLFGADTKAAAWAVIVVEDCEQIGNATKKLISIKRLERALHNFSCCSAGVDVRDPCSIDGPGLSRL